MGRRIKSRGWRGSRGNDDNNIVSMDAKTDTDTHKNGINTVADLRGREGRTPPPASKFFQFHAVFGRIWQNCVFTSPLGGFTPPSGGNLGSVTAIVLNSNLCLNFHKDIIVKNTLYSF